MQKTSRLTALILRLAGVLLGCLVLTTPALAQWGARIWFGGPPPVYHGGNYHGWQGNGGTWDDPGNWRGGEDNYRFGDGWDDNSNAIAWRGSIDDKVDIYFHGAQWTADVLSGNSLDDPHARFLEPLPFHREHVRLAKVEGRGNVYIFQQPDRNNGYTVGVRMYDPQPSRNWYKFALVWD